ncbi:hypothetical protein [Brevundimonas sp. SORGH_AS_0993]|uniref:hypothetical protein n=1 Tax=Brevundimonas sp. SORGH_AS_0993 TaxID=3041794 RepID=UPI0027898751|nr:hypothetical protein [Brevundimonas sp. SORGH_AS_0993]MDQ1154073.1 hypothetical protein [Brevundimonas sp. SORGH_AS_0993]
MRLTSPSRPTMPLLALAALTACLSACASGGVTTPAPQTASTGVPSPTPGYDWLLDQDGREVTLAYGQPNSDDLKLQLICQGGTGRLQLAAVFDKPARVLHVESGGDDERYPARSEPAAIHEGQYVTADAQTKDPVFQRFRRLGWLALWQGDDRETLAAHPGSLSNVERFFAACG